NIAIRARTIASHAERGSRTSPRMRYMKRFLLFAGALVFAEPAAATAAAPEIFVLSPASPPAEAVQGTLAGTFTALDRAAASSETWHYELVAGDGDTDNVRFQIQQDQLVTS